MAKFKNVIYYGDRLCKKMDECTNCPLSKVTEAGCLFAHFEASNIEKAAEEIENIIADDLAKELKERGLPSDRIMDFGLDGLE